MSEANFQVTVRLHGGGIFMFGVTGSSQHKAAERWLPRIIKFHDQISRITVEEIELPEARKIRQLLAMSSLADGL